MLMIRFVAPAGNHPEYGSRWRIFFRRSSTRGSNVFCDFALPERFPFLLIFPPDTVDVHMVAGAASIDVSSHRAAAERRLETGITESRKGDEPDERPVRESLIQYFENAGSVSVESTPGMPWTFVTTDSRRFSRGSALMRATMSESPVVPMISWISGTFLNSLIVFCVSVERSSVPPFFHSGLPTGSLSPRPDPVSSVSHRVPRRLGLRSR